MKFCVCFGAVTVAMSGFTAEEGKGIYMDGW